MKKIYRFLRSFRSQLYDPKLILEQNIREMNDKIPLLNERIEKTKDRLKELEQELSQFNKKISKARKSLKQARKQKHIKEITLYTEKLEDLKKSLSLLKEKITEEEDKHRKIVEEQVALKKDIQVKIDEAKKVLRANERSRWQSKIADVFENMPEMGLKFTLKQEKLETELKAYTFQVEDCIQRFLNGEYITKMEIPKDKVFENKKLLLEENIRSMNAQIPAFNDAIATVKASVSLLKKELNRDKSEGQDIDLKIKSQHATANLLYEKSLEQKEEFMITRQRMINEAKECLREVEQSKWMHEIISIAIDLKNGDENREELIEKIEERFSLLEKEADRYNTEYQDLVKKSKEAEKEGRTDILQNYLLRITYVKKYMDRTVIHRDKVASLVTKLK